MAIRRYPGSNVLGRVTGQEVPGGYNPMPVSTPPPPSGEPDPYGSVLDRQQGAFNVPGMGTNVWDLAGAGGVDEGPTTGGPQIGEVKEQVLDSGRVIQYRYDYPTSALTGLPIQGASPTWIPQETYFGQSGGAGGSDPAYLAETVRSNMAREAEARRRRAMDAASNAASAFLTGTQLADARQLNAFQESRSLLPYLIDPEQQYAGGQEPGGVVDRAMGSLGIPGFQPSEIQHKQLSPAQMAIPPTGEQVGSDIVDYIGGIEEGGR